MCIRDRVAAIPFWVWSALHAWTWMLLALVPLAAIGIVSDGHIRAAVAQPPEANAMLTPRGHRLAAWVGVLGSALIALALGAVGAMALIALEAGTSQDAPGGPRRSIVVVDAALLWVALCWIVSL